VSSILPKNELENFNIGAEILEKVKFLFCPQEVEKNHPKKLHTYGSWKFFSLQP
jgi:hypothetical protein